MKVADEFHDLSELALNQDGQSWGNLGFWEAGQQDYSAACRALAIRLGHAARLDQNSTVFDAGFGCGDQLELWLDHFQVVDICGVNLSQGQTLWAKKRLAERENSDHAISIVQGSIGEKSNWLRAIGSRKISRVIALDCAYHFPNRIDFFQRANAALSNSGGIALTDFMLDGDLGTRSLKYWLLMVMLRFSRIPSANIVTNADYKLELAARGFDDVVIEDISEPVMMGFASGYHKGRKLLPPSLPLKARLKYAVTATFLKWAYHRSVLRYCLITGQKHGD